MGRFWENETMISFYPRVAPLGRWYASYVSSSVAAERGFGVLRGIDLPNRRHMDHTLFRLQMLMRYDHEAVDDLFDRRMGLAKPPALRFTLGGGDLYDAPLSGGGSASAAGGSSSSGGGAPPSRVVDVSSDDDSSSESSISS